MFSPELKRKISAQIQQLLASLDHFELPEGEIQFLLHVDGTENWSWANIKNNNAINYLIPTELKRNMYKGKMK